MRTSRRPPRRYKTRREQYQDRRTLSRRARDFRTQRPWYQRKHLLFPLLGFFTVAIVLVLTAGVMKFSQPQTVKQDTILLPTPAPVMIAPNVMDGSETMDYELAKRIFAGEVIGETTETSLK